jgi:hypothetical protein
MTTFKYIFFMRCGSLEFSIGQKLITANNVDDANKILSKSDLPFHHFSTVQKLNNHKL